MFFNFRRALVLSPFQPLYNDKQLINYQNSCTLKGEIRREHAALTGRRRRIDKRRGQCAGASQSSPEWRPQRVVLHRICALNYRAIRLNAGCTRYCIGYAFKRSRASLDEIGISVVYFRGLLPVMENLEPNWGQDGLRH